MKFSYLYLQCTFPFIFKQNGKIDGVALLTRQNEVAQKLVDEGWTKTDAGFVEIINGRAFLTRHFYFSPIVRPLLNGATKNNIVRLLKRLDEAKKTLEWLDNH